MSDLHEIAENQLRNQIKMGFLVLDNDSEAEGEQKNIEEHKDKIRGDMIEEIKDKKLKVEFVKAHQYNNKIADAIAEFFVRKLPGTNKNKIQDLKALVSEALMGKSYELQHRLHNLRIIENVERFTDNLFREFELVDQGLRDSRYLRETDDKLTIRFSDKNTREHANKQTKNQSPRIFR